MKLISPAILPLIAWTINLPAQTDSMSRNPALEISAFVDIYYAYDFNKPENGVRQDFLYNHNRHNEFNLNLGLAQLQMDGGVFRANLGLMAGTYAQDNLAAEEELLKNVFEANAGLSLGKTRKLWLDAGIFSSHLGFESAISANNWTLTRSLAAENSPYYFAGAKLTFDPGDKLTLAALIVNGWQRIRRVPGNSLPGFGTQLNYHPDDRTMFNWSTFVGSDQPDEERRIRIFNNLYGQFQLSEKLGLIAGFDIGAEQKEKNSPDYYFWYAPVAIMRFAPADDWALGLRAEYYIDKNQVIIATGTPNGFQTSGFSTNIDYQPFPNVLCRIEGRLLKSEDAIFSRNEDTVKDNFCIVGSISVKLDQ